MLDPDSALKALKHPSADGRKCNLPGTLTGRIPN